MGKILQNKKFQTILFISLTVIVTFILLKDNFLEVMNEIFKMNIIWILITILLIFGYWLFKSMGSYIIIRQVNPNFKIKDALKLNLVVQFFNSITPFAIGGHPVQVHMLKKYDIGTSNGTNITIQNFIVYQIAIVIIELSSVIIALITNLFGNDIVIQSFVIGGLILDLFIILMLFVLAFSKKIKSILIKFSITILTKLKIVKDEEKKLEEWDIRINNFHNGAIKLIKNKKEFLKAIMFNFIGLIIFYMTPLTLLFATGDYSSFNLIQSIYIISCVSMAADLIPTPGQLGGIEYGFTALFDKYISKNVLSAILIAFRFLSYYLTIIIGVITMNIKNNRIKKDQSLVK